MNKDKRNNIQLLGTLNNADESGIIANANQVYDANEDKSTQDVSKEHKERIETLETKESSMQTTLENITKTGEASAASNVTYNHSDSKLDASNVQQAIDEVYSKGNTNRENDKTELEKSISDNKVAVDASIQDVYKKSNYNDGDNIIDFNTIHLITDNPEFICVAVDTNNKILYGVKADGQPYFGVGCPQQVKDYIDEQINKILGTNDITTTIDSLKEIEAFLKDFTNSDTLKALLDTKANKTDVDSSIAGISADIADKYKKSNPNDSAGNIVDTNTIFSIKDNPEYIKTLTDSVGKLIEAIGVDGIRRFFAGINIQGTLQCITDNPEYIAVWIDNQNRIVLGFKTNGDTYFGYGVPSQIKEYISIISTDVQVKLDSITQDLANTKEDIDKKINFGDNTYPSNVHEVSDNPEFVTTETDIDGRLLSSVDNEGNKTIYGDANVKGSLNVGDLKLKNKNDLKTVLKEEHFIGNFDWSDDKFVELPKPNVAAKINLIVDHLATAKGQNIKGYMEYWDKLGNYFKKPIVLNGQGASSMQWWIKNQAIDIDDGSTIKFGNWRPFDSFHLKKFYIDSFRGQCIVGYWLTEQVYKTRPLGQQRPNDYLKSKSTTTNGSGTFASDFETGALFHPDGFPVMMYLNGALQGLYAFCIKKDRDNYEMSKKNHLQIHLDGIIGSVTLFGGVIDYTQFEVRNPKVDKDIDGNKYDGDKPKEPSAAFQDTKDAITRISNAYNTMKAAPTKEVFETYFNVPFYIDKVLISNAIWDQDGFWKNWQWHTWDGKIWCPTLYDLDSIFGMRPDGMSIVPAGEKLAIGKSTTAWTNTNTVLGLNSQNGDLLWKLYSTEIKARYKELRNDGIFTTDNIVGLLRKWLDMCGYDNLKTDLEECCAYNGVPQTPSYRDGSKTYEKKPTTEGFYNSVPRVKAWLDEHFAYLDEVFEYNTNSTSNS